MEELNLTRRTQLDEGGRPRVFCYALLVDEVESGNFFCENYGVRVWEEGGESMSIPGITTSAMRIDQLLTLLIDNKVGPTSLSEVVADWL